MFQASEVCLSALWTARKVVRVLRSALLKFAFEAMPSADRTAALRFASGIHVAGSGVVSGRVIVTVCDVAAVFGLFATSVATLAAMLIGYGATCRRGYRRCVDGVITVTHSMLVMLAALPVRDTSDCAKPDTAL